MRTRPAFGASEVNAAPAASLLSALEVRAARAPHPLLAGRLADLVKVALGVLLLALLAQVRVQIGPVPITGQTLGVLLVGAGYGLSLGVSTTLAYLLLGAVGLPLFVGGAGGLAYLAGPTGGYLVGFVLAAALLGAAARRGWDRCLWSSALAMAAASVAIYAVGLAWLHYGSGLPWSTAVAVGLAPFLVGDAIKLAIAAAALPAAWRLLGQK